ncbi:hypothetical protein [Clostridium paraputrificum]|uniref:hypothetical protein n=1 Tax=Clostridium paraputrificum TaxID=29363 RepID=UPI0006C45211|nr:hypothetical protein [Clostridium paraputrificum]CUO20869.1 Uncharacterised protein [Clostridium paraputrificum]
MDLYTELEIYRIAVLVGLYSREDMLTKLDNIIEDLEDIPYEIIEASLGKKTDDILMIIEELINKHCFKKDVVLGSLINLIEKRHNENLINTFEGIYYLEQLEKYCDFNDYDREYIIYLSNGYYLANEGIYGEMNKIEIDFNNFLTHLSIKYGE